VNGRLEVVEGGFAAVTDLGRHGQAQLGVQVNGAADRYSARQANILAGNDEAAPLIEATTIAPFAFRTPVPQLIAVTGAVGAVTIDGHPMPGNTPVITWAGALVRIPPGSRGLRAYVGVHGRLAGDEFLGSVAVDSLLGRGRRLAPGDVVEVADSAVRVPRHLPFFRLTAGETPLSNEWVLDVVPGPEAAEFPAFSERLPAVSFRVGERSDHAGVRLEGQQFARSTTAEILSRGVPLGAIEAPPSGGLIALLRGRPLNAGYPIPAVVARSSHQSLAQLRPGDTVRLRHVSAAASIAVARADEARLAELRGRCSAMFDACAIFAESSARATVSVRA
jgi:biotin-dependent carboxylase-like uncharacterized protein